MIELIHGVGSGSSRSGAALGPGKIIPRGWASGPIASTSTRPSRLFPGGHCLPADVWDWPMIAHRVFRSLGWQTDYQGGPAAGAALFGVRLLLGLTG